MKKIWKTWKPRKKESRGNQELYFINTPKNESTWCLYMCSRRLRRLLRFTEPHSRPEHLLIVYHNNMFNL